MRLIPAIDLKAGRCVRLLYGDFERETRYVADPQELAAKYQELSNEASRQFLAIEASHPATAAKVDDDMEDLAPKSAPQQILPDAGFDALRDMLYEKAGPFRAPDDSRKYYPAAAEQQQFTRLRLTAQIASSEETGYQSSSSKGASSKETRDEGSSSEGTPSEEELPS